MLPLSHSSIPLLIFIHSPFNPPFLFSSLAFHQRSNMIKTLVPFSNTARTAEIMSRYRPIAPKPTADNSPNITPSHYLRNTWPPLQPRPRKRGRAAVSPPAFKRTRTHYHQHHFLGVSFAPFPFHGVQSDLVTLPLLPAESEPRGKLVIDLNGVAEIPEDNSNLSLTPPSPTTNVVSPQPIRPVGSAVRVRCISSSEDPTPTSPPPLQILKKPEEVEREVESEELPAIISDSNYRVRMANSAYKEMVGQPECSWLDSIVSGKRICGEVALHLAHSEVPSESDKFFCWVSIEWRGHENGRKKAVHAFCDVVRLPCLSKDYLFSWRFHTRGSSHSATSNA